MTYAVIGHFTPTDAEIDENWPGQSGKLDKDIACFLCDTHAYAEEALIWYPDGVIVKVTK